MSEPVKFAGLEVEVRTRVFVSFCIAQDGSGEGAIRAVRPEAEDDAHIPESDGTNGHYGQYRCAGKVISHMRLSKEAWHTIYAMMEQVLHPNPVWVADNSDDDYADAGKWING